jgi:acetyl-CoA carboxylase carboxyl transferase subunit beta
MPGATDPLPPKPAKRPQTLEKPRARNRSTAGVRKARDKQGGDGAPAPDPKQGQPGAGVPPAQIPAPRAEGETEKPPEKLSETRFSRLRKKKDMPGGLWLKCESCSQMIYRKELEEKGRVCPACDFHFTLPGRERIAMVLDPGTWREHYADLRTIDRLKFNDQVPYLEKVKKAEERTGQAEALLCGEGSIEGRPVILAVLDFSFMGGSMGEIVGEKISLAAELAGVQKKPLVIFTSSGGARMHEGVISLMQMAKTSSALARFYDGGGYAICVLTHPTTGGVTASFASVCDVTLAEPGALIGFAGPRVIATTLKQELPPGFQRAEFLLAKGQIDRIVRRAELRSVLARLIDYGRGPLVR